jgi:hypothetical protein
VVFGMTVAMLKVARPFDSFVEKAPSIRCIRIFGNIIPARDAHEKVAIGCVAPRTIEKGRSNCIRPVSLDGEDFRNVLFSERKAVLRKVTIIDFFSAMGQTHRLHICERESGSWDYGLQ